MVDPCTLQNGGCSTNATCTSTGAAVTCTCKPTYVGDGGTCLSDPCLTNNGGCGTRTTCTPNAAAVAQCVCASGYRVVDGGTTCTPVWTPVQLSPFETGAIGWNAARQRLALVVPGSAVWESASDAGWEAREIGQPTFTLTTFDRSSGRMFGIASGLWSYDGLRWRFESSGGPTYSYGLAYDEGRHQLVVSSGAATWTWDGAQWTSYSGPHPGSTDQMAYDGAGQRVVVFNHTGETWAWSGTSWTQLSTVNGPDGRSNAAFVFDSQRNVMVLFGGGSGNGAVGDLWELGGNTWTRRTPANGPTPRYSMAAGWDPNTKEVVIGGGALDVTVPSAELWRWNGTTWRRDPQQSPDVPDPTMGRIATDTTRNVLVLSATSTVAISIGGTETWEWNGSWAKIATSTTGSVSWPVLTFDSARNVLQKWDYFDSTDTSTFEEWNGTSWTTRTATPSARGTPCVGYDPVRARTVLFGGVNGAKFSSDTWTRSSTTWTARAPSTSPSPRWNCPVVWDPVRQAIVLVGGTEWVSLQGPRGLVDAWTWSGTNWSSLSINAPSSPLGAVWDSSRQRIVMIDGSSKTYSLEASAWNDLAADVPGILTTNSSFAAKDGRIYLFGSRAWGTNGVVGTFYFLPPP